MRRRVLVVARTLTATNRLLDVLPAVQGDPRVQVVFTLDEGSAYAEGARRALDALRVPYVPWQVAVRRRWDLAVSASANPRLAALDAPVLVVGHGAAHNRYLADADELAGLSRHQLLHNGRLVPDVIGLSHPDLRARLAPVHPDAAARGVVVGDPCADRIDASRRHRARYRAALGVGRHQRLVTLTSTWGRESLLGRQPTLPARLLGALPADAYRVALIAHPNVWIGHGAWQLRAWLATAVEAGLILVPPADGWQAALVAADVVVADHGSTGLYAAALDLPILLGAYGGAEIVADSATDLFARRAARLDARGPLATQLDAAATGHRPGGWDSVVSQAFSARGRSLELLRAACYRLMDLPEPTTPVYPRAVRVPAVGAARPTAYRVVVDRVGPETVALHRFPAAVAEPDDELPGAHHLAVGEADASPHRFVSAAVVYRDGDADDDWAEGGPACRLSAVLTPDGRCVLRHRGGPTLVARWLGSGATAPDPALLASAAYALGPDFRGRLRVELGTVSHDADISPAGAAAPPAPR